ncbi:hypothetical protein [Actinoplanes sp. NPDC051851]|uniref:hypothetical protein n=1 Tax=Actinoplanes sp. NPDC051851 TaxID=3154753 RepID=UPI003438CB0B
MKGPIDRQAVVRRHTVEVTAPDPGTPLTVGNGDFAYTADITGMQTFTGFHDQTAAMARQRLAVNTATLSNWGWHEMPNPRGHVLADAMTAYETARGTVHYPDRYDMTAAMTGAPIPERLRAGTWLHQNPQRLDLGRIGLLLRRETDAEPETDPAALTGTHQRLDLWTGELTSVFTYAGHQVRVSTVADPVRSRVAFRIASRLLADGRAAVAIRFPYASDGFFTTSDWSLPDRHHSDARHPEVYDTRIDRTVDGTRYAVHLSGRFAAGAQPHQFVRYTGAETMDVVVDFTPADRPGELATFDEIRRAAAVRWRDFWMSGAAVDFAGSTDERAPELERRVVLSQYLTAVNCSGSLPPQETGLITNSWQGKFHLEMHWWHAAHFTTWGRSELMERSLDWYLSTLDVARDTARRQRYAGARWPKHVGPDGRESPSAIGAFLVWQQPHPLYLLELLHRSAGAEAGAELVERFAVLVEETAAFMADFAQERDGAFHLLPPLLAAQEFYDATTVEDPTFEVAYWWYGLEIAQRWRERRGLARDQRWKHLQESLARPRQDGGCYAAVATEPYLTRDDHPSLLCALGVLPATPLIDPAVMAATLNDVLGDWAWDTAWGWDFPVLAMTATRTGQPGTAVDALLMDTPKNQWTVAGHTPQMGALLPVYLPSNGGLLAAVSLMAAGWDGSGDCPGFPAEGWTVRHEGFTPWP